VVSLETVDLDSAIRGACKFGLTLSLPSAITFISLTKETRQSGLGRTIFCLYSRFFPF
jgi:hypothetical protein